MPVQGIAALVGDGAIALSLALTADVIAVMARRINAVALKRNHRRIFAYELLLCGALLVCALDARFGFLTASPSPIGRRVGWILRIGAGLGTAGTLFFALRVLRGCLVNTAAPADYAIVLGMALENGRPTAELLSRVDAARDYLADNPESTLVLTGGNSEGSRTEAAVMRDLLRERGVPDGRMILEDAARTTVENFTNTAQLIDPEQPVVLITSDTHMDRAVRTAARAGFTQVLRLPAPTDARKFGANLMWEVVMEAHDLFIK